ncbi:phosphatase PAP2 family protein [Bacillus sp. MRMR6]|uniref:phosphatase PAP2 family protein n=1 Tax=Bacillus sp. MRMR6 TaxID=1928617 RepID=UPI000950C0BB|nr:phosphatase PAP2 family protein [Bacillus sp. MRMR6]OLS40930.1 phosphatase PAP2 family protein [Bacillus sp. MRMR6]
MKTIYNFLFILSVLCLVAFVLLANIYDSDFVKYFDIQTIKSIQGLEQPILTTIMKFFSYIGDTIQVIIISIIILVILYKVFHQRVELILFTIVLVGSTTLNVLLKTFFQRERPIFYQMVIEESFSFPSGHSMAALSLYGIISFLLWRHIPKQSGRIVLITVSAIFILVIGISRIYLGVHYPSDIVGAYLISGFWLMFTIWGFINIRERSLRKDRTAVNDSPQ